MPPVCDCCPPQQLGCLVLYSCLHIQELLNFKRIEQDLMSPPPCLLSLPLACHFPPLLAIPPLCSLSLPLACLPLVCHPSLPHTCSPFLMLAAPPSHSLPLSCACHPACLPSLMQAVPPAHTVALCQPASSPSSLNPMSGM